MDLEKNVQLLSSLWPIILSLLGGLYGYISLNFRMKRQEEKSDARDKADIEKLNTLAKIGQDISGIEKSQAVIAAKMEYLTRPVEHR